MKSSTFNKLIISADKEMLKIYYHELLSKAKEIDKEGNYIGVGMIILIFLYYTADVINLINIQIGPISLSDFHALQILTPPILSFLILRFIIVSAHKIEIHQIIKKISQIYYGVDNTKIKIEDYDDLTRTILPVSNFRDLSIFVSSSGWGCVGLILFIPLIAVALLPYGLTVCWIIKDLAAFSDLMTLHKMSILISIWLIFITTFYTIAIAIKAKKNMKQ